MKNFAWKNFRDRDHNTFGVEVVADISIEVKGTRDLLYWPKFSIYFPT